MKKTLTINLNSTVWSINEDAYQTLKSYLEELEQKFSSNEEQEILSDIEARISELFAERLCKKRTVVELADVEYVIATLGKVSDITEEHEPKEEKKKRSKRFYRNPDNKIVGGVASGLAAYLGWDTTLVRILFLLLLIFGTSYFLPTYLLLWLIAPEAETFAQKLEMNGEEVTVDNIRTLKNRIIDKLSDEKQAKTFMQRLGEVIRCILKWGLIIIGASIGLAIAFVCIASVFGLSIFGVALLAEPTWFEGFATANGAAFFVALLLIFLLPLIGCVLLLIRLLGREPRKRTSTWVWITLTTIWFVAFLVLTFTAIRFDRRPIISTIAQYAHNRESETRISEPRQVSSFNAIHLDNALNVKLLQGEDCAVRISADANALNNITTEVCDSVLYVYSSVGYKGEVEIALPTIKSIVAKSACSIECDSPIVSPTLEVELNGASNATLDVDVQCLTLHMEQAALAEIEGNTHKLFLRTNGAANAVLDDLHTRIADIETQSASHVSVQVSDTLRCDLSGQSLLNYKGHPKLICSRNHLSRIENDND